MSFAVQPSTSAGSVGRAPMRPWMNVPIVPTRSSRQRPWEQIEAESVGSSSQPDRGSMLAELRLLVRAAS
jgi:hypothetical protein